jgi:hypothetical protein
LAARASRLHLERRQLLHVVLDVADAVPPEVAEVQAEADYERTLFWSAE